MNVKNIKRAPYCVYGHFSDGVCFYIGSGSFKRAFDFERDRNPGYIRKVKHVSDLSVVIMHQCSNRDDAYRLEKQLIMLCKPSENMQILQGIAGRAKRAAAAEKRRELNQPAREDRERRKAEKALKQRIKRQGHLKRVYPIKCVNTGRYFYGFHHAGRVMNLCPSRISAQLRGKTKMVDGYKFERATWEESGLDKMLICKPGEQPL